MAKRKAKGFGDTIEAITEATGIKAVVETFSKATGIDCGCDKRKETLNKLFPYNRNINCLTEADYNLLTGFLDPLKNTLTPTEQLSISSSIIKHISLYALCSSTFVSSNNSQHPSKDTLLIFFFLL